MNAPRFSFTASRTIRSFFLSILAGLLLAGLLASTSQAGMTSVKPHGIGAALALMAQLRSAQAHVKAAADPAGGDQRTPDGRTLLDRGMMRPGAILNPHATNGGNTVPIPGAVQTFDVANPPPAFQPLVGFQNPDGSIGNNPANPPFYQANNILAPTNLTPVWSADESFLIFSSNRTLSGDVAPDGRFHIWAISINGGEAYQITTSTTGSGEFFPTLSGNDGKLAFISDAQSAGTENLYVLNQFSYPVLLGMNNTQTFVNVSQPDPSKGGITSVTIRTPPGQTTTTEAQSEQLTGFDQVQRPQFAPGNDSELIFSAHSIFGTNANHYHIFFLFTNSGGFDANNVSYPGKLTDGPADDTDPAISKDGQFVTFASTATSVVNQTAGHNAFGPNDPTQPQDPNQSQSLTQNPDANGLRSIFLLGGGTRGLGFGTVPASLIDNNGVGHPLTAPGTDNFGPAWSFNNRNQYTNPTPGFEYLAFARGAGPTAPHDIYYIQGARIIDPVGESRRSSEAATTPDPRQTPLYQIDAGGPGAGTYVSDNALDRNGQPAFTVTGGAPRVDAAATDTSGDPGTPPQIYNNDRNAATFTYDLPNLTPNATYTVRLHFSDPDSATAGTRLINVTANGQPALNNFDIAATAGAQSTPPVAGVQNKAVVVGFVINASGNGHITLVFTGAKGNAIVQGIEVLTTTSGANPPPSSGFGLLVNSGDSSAPANITVVGDVVSNNPQITLTAQVPNNSNNLGVPVAYNIYRSPGGQTSDNLANNSGGGREGTVPTYPNVTPAPGGALRFVDTNVQAGVEYFYQVTAIYQEQITPEGFAEPNGAANTAVKLNTDDNAGEVVSNGSQDTSNSGNGFDDIYPAWSPFLSIFSITYQSGGFNYSTGAVTNSRTVTYNDPVTSFPQEKAASVPQNGAVHTSDPNHPVYTVGPAYTGIFESQVLNLDPPTLLRFSPNEIVHVQAGSNTNPVTGTPSKLGINPGQTVTLTVRMSDRESGIDETGAFNGGPNGAQVYVQIKNPNSKYQDAQSLEHKVFAKDSQFNNQPNRQTLNDINSGTANLLLGLGFNGYEGIFNIDGTSNVPNQKFGYPSYGTPDQTSPGTNHVSGRGAHGGHWAFPNANNPDNTFIYVGRNGGGVNPYANGGNIFYNFKNPPGGPGGDPSRFIPLGPEYECQLVNPQFMTSGGPNGPGDTSPLDFVDPYWLAGVDDQQAFSGVGKVRPTTNSTKPNGNVAPAEWLQMKRVPVTLPDGSQGQDNKGGVLYTVTWKTPTSASDFYLDIIAFDQAVFPNIPQGTSIYNGHSVNWRIYDNVGGFSTVQSIPNNDILVVSDYALGQKFAATTFAGRNSNLNLVPKLFGTESYLTDVDVSTLPDSVYGGYTIATLSPGPPPSYVSPFNFIPGLSDPTTSTFGFVVPVLNALGVNSFNDQVVDDGGRRDGAPDVGSQRYAIWRILARGPVPDAVLNSYLPTRVGQPAITDTLSPDPAYRSISAGTVMDAHRCIVWLSPYTGDLLTDPGSLDDPGTPAQNGATARPSTQSVLRNFVLGDGTSAHPGGGRLFLTGQDVGATLTLGGSVGNTAGGFLPDVLNATLATPGGGTRVLNATANRITGNPNYDGTAPSTAYPQLIGTMPGTYQGGGNPFRLQPGGGQYPYLDTLALGSNDHDDAALDQIPSQRLVTGASVQGQIDTIAAVNGASLAATYDNGQGALVFHDDPLRTDATFKPGTPNGGVGSRVVYAAFGLEALSTDYYSTDAPDSNALDVNYIPDVIPHNARQQVLHNIVCYLRTGSVSGIITQTAGTGQGAGQGVSGVTVYLKPVTSTAPPTRAAFSATTASDGRFTILGVEPGTYTLVAYKPGYTRAVSNAGVSFTVEGDVNLVGESLTVTPLPPGQIAGSINDPSGTPIIGAVATFTSQDKTVVKTATTRDGSQPNQPAGSYFVDNVPVTNYTAIADGPLNDENLPEYLEASAPNKPFDTGVVVQPNTPTQPVNFTLTPILATITGRIYDNTPPPVGGNNATGGGLTAGATVTLTDSAGKPVPGVAPVSAGADGTYTFTNVPAAQAATTYTITATKAGYSTTNNSTTVPVFLGDKITDLNHPNVDIGLTQIPFGILTGQVTDKGTTTPVAGALVTFVSADGTITKTATADANGNYTINKVPPGTYNGTATGPLNPNKNPTAASDTPVTVTVASTTPANPSTTVNLDVIPTPPSFAGTVTDAKTTKPLPGAVITITDSSGGSTNGNVVKKTTTAADGTYTTGTLPPGTYTISAALVGYANGSLASQTIYEGDALTAQNIALTPIAPGSISGQVTDQQTGGPVVGAVVTIKSNDGTQTLTSGPTDTNGNYSIPASALLSDPAGPYTGTAVGPNNANSKPEYQPSASQPVTVPSGTTATAVNFVLTEIPAVLSGIVTDQQTGKGIPSVTLTLVDNTGKTVATTTSAADGTYKINPVPAGQSVTAYTLNATVAAGYFPGSLPLPSGISLGDTLTLNIPLNEQGTVTGLVTDKTTGQPLSNVSLTITDTTTGGTVTTTPATLVTANNTSTGPDGQPENYVATFVLTPGDKYAVTATKPNYNASSPIPVTPSPLTNTTAGRADIQLVSSIGTLGGLVSDASSGTSVGGATITVTSASGTVVATLITNGSATAGPDGKPVNYSGQVTQGTYTVTLTKGNRTPVTQTKIVVVGGAFNRVDFAGATGLPALYTFPGGQIYFLSLPYDYSSVGFDSLFGTLNTAPSGTTPNGNRSHVAVWDPLAGQYALDPNPPADTLRLGMGYWIFLKSTVNITQQGATPNTPYVAVTLHPSWNQIGVPSITPISVASLKFDNGAGGMISFATASSSQFHLVSPTLYSFDGASYQPVTQSSVLQPTKAYWIKVFTDATVEIPTSAATGTTTPAVP